MTNSDPYAWWKRALAGGKIGGKDLPVHENEPQSGFYRLRYGKDKPWQPVAIWFDEDGKLIVVVSGKVASEPEGVWISCCRHPIEEPEYHKVANGGEWSDALEPLTPPSAEAGIGHNEPPDEFALLKEEIDAAIASAEAELDKPDGIQSKADADRIANMTDRLRELFKNAEAMRKAEKKPFDDGAKAVQKKFKPILDDIEDTAKSLKAPLSAYLRDQERIAEEAARKAHEEAEAKARAEAEAKAKAEAEAKGEEADLAKVEVGPVEVPDIEPVRQKVGGYGGKRMSLRTQVSAEVTDYAKALDHYKDRPEVRDLIQTLANRSARAGEIVPGVERIEEKVAA